MPPQRTCRKAGKQESVHLVTLSPCLFHLQKAVTKSCICTLHGCNIISLRLYKFKSNSKHE